MMYLLESSDCDQCEAKDVPTVEFDVVAPVGSIIEYTSFNACIQCLINAVNLYLEHVNRKIDEMVGGG